ncbi:hypothetical protein V490_00139 [Pseudogymnoascus sp. VKM F-3557]|nr:hypothetical protein V490_00139 [Pseudogymnoascus sp. VKM F-3557]
MAIVSSSESLRLPPSPSLSGESTLGSPRDDYTQDTQEPTSIRDKLHARGIKAAELNERYNRQSVPIMADDRFYQLLDIASRGGHDGNDMESELKRTLQEIGNPLLEDYNAAKFEFGMKGMDRIEPSYMFAAFLREQTIHSCQGFIAYCLPFLIETAGKDRRMRQRRTGRKHHLEPHTSNTPSQAPRCATRRSDRISRARSRENPRRSDRIRTQRGRARNVQ